MPTQLRVLIVEDSENDALLILRELKRGGYEPTHERVETAEAMKAALETQQWDIVISDYSMPQFSAPGALEVLKERGLDLPFIIVSGTVGEETAVASLKTGAHDFIAKTNLMRFLPAVERELREGEVRRARKRAEEALSASEVRYRRLFESAKDGILILDADTGVVIDVNPFLVEMLGFSREQLLGKTIWEPGFLKDIVANRDNFLELQRQEYVRYEDLPLETAFGRQMEVEFVSNVYLVDHKKVIQCNIRDITEIKRAEAEHEKLEAQFRQSQKLEGIGLLAGGVAHDFNNILMGISGFTQFALKGMPEGSSAHNDLTQVLVNLVVNARDAMPEGGKLTIETTNVFLDEDYACAHQGVTPGEYVMLAVSDTGCGMDAQTIERAFEPFFTTKPQGKGTGLGLSMVYGIVKQSGGNVWAYSEPGKGTTLKIYLPSVAVNAAEGTAARAPDVQRGTETILVVEDDDPVRQVVQRVLELQGYRVLTAASPSQADEALAAHGESIALLLTDIMLPERNGRQLYEAVRVRYPRLRVLYMSGYTDNAIVHHGMLDPGTAFIQKPFTADTLARKVREVLGGPRDDD